MNGINTNTDAVVAIYPTHEEAEAGVKELQNGGFDMRKLSVVGKDFHTDEHVVGYYNSGDRMVYWGNMGAFWGGLWGLLFGAAFFWVPGVGPLLVAGPLASTIVAALESALVIGTMSALGAAFWSLGIPEDSILKYETAIKADKYVLVAHGTASEAAKAIEILEATKPAALNRDVLATTTPTGAEK
jgi:uncharacterized membrane protein